MTRELAGIGRLLVLPTLALAVVAAFVPGRLELAVRIYALIVGAAVLARTLLALRRAFPPARPLARDLRSDLADRRPPGTLARLEHEVALGVSGAFELHHRLRPHLRWIAAGLLLTRRGMALDRDRRDARTILGDGTWELVREDREPPRERLARGLTADELEQVVDALERV